MIIRKKELVSSISLILVLVIFLFVYLPITEAFKRDAFIAIQFLLIGFISVIGLLEDSREKPFSLGMIFWFFSFAFLFCGGITQFAKNVFKWGLVTSNSEIEYTNIVIILFLAIFFLSRKSRIKFVCGNNKKILSFWNKEKEITSFSILPIVVILGIIGMYTVVTSGWVVLLIREVFGTSGIVSKIENSSIRTLITTIIRGLATWIMMITANNVKKKRNATNIIMFAVALFVGILNVPPTGVARYVMGAVYGGILIYVFDKLKKGRILLYSLSIGLLLVFPLMNAFRGHYTNVITWEFIQKSLGDISSNFTKADYDAYSMIVFSVQYVKKVGVSYGCQLLGALLFFIPSNIWKGKPEGSGATIIEYMSPDYDSNVSCPIIAEGYLNFGIVGIILFALLLGYITRRIDDSFWENWVNKNCFGHLTYCFLIPFFLFLCRGDLLSTFSYLVGYLAALIIIDWMS